MDTNQTAGATSGDAPTIHRCSACGRTRAEDELAPLVGTEYDGPAVDLMACINTTDCLQHQLPHGGSVLQLRIDVARGAARAERRYRKVAAGLFGDRDRPPLSAGEAAALETAQGATLNGWAVAALLGWIEQEHGHAAAHRAAVVVQLMAVDGGTQGLCDDLTPYLRDLT